MTGAARLVERHETELAHAIGAPHAVCFGYARHALVAILEAAELAPGDAVVLSPLTCKVVPLALFALGLEPVWADVAEETLNADREELARAAADPRVRAILFQHTYGQGAGLDGAERVARERGLVLVEDCAQCLPTRAAAPSAGRAGPPRRAAIFSNNLMKPLPAGSGGVATTADPELAAGIRRARERFAPPGAAQATMQRLERFLHAALLRPSTYWPLFGLAQRFASHYEQRSIADEVAREIRSRPGRISAAQARVGSQRLALVSALAEHRRTTCRAYATLLAGVAGLALPRANDDLPLCYFPVRVAAKDELLRRARRARIELVPWPVRTPIYPIEDERELASYGYVKGSCPIAEEIAAELVGLPTHEKIGERELHAVARLVREHCEGS